MQKKLLDMQDEIYSENGEQIVRINKRSAELGAEAKYCSECSTKQK